MFESFIHTPTVPEDVIDVTEDLIDIPLSDNIEPISTSLSEFTEFAIHIDGNPFTFDGWEFFLPIYDSPHKRKLLKCSRQVGKSTTLGNTSIGRSCLLGHYHGLYVCPTEIQATAFSSDKLRTPIETSPKILAFLRDRIQQNVNQKRFVFYSTITLRYCYLNADRVRGLKADYIMIDELQDILINNIPVIEACAYRSKYQDYMYAGTPKSLDNTIEHYWSDLSTQNEWAIPCHCRRTSTGTGAAKTTPYFNVVIEDSIGKEGLICTNCGKRIYPRHGFWAVTGKADAPFEGYRICHLMIEGINWTEVVYAKDKWPRAQLYNELLGISYDSGVRPITRTQLMDACIESQGIYRWEDLEKLAQLPGQKFIGVDWGVGETQKSYTVAVVGMYLNNEFVIVFAHRFTGKEAEPTVRTAKVLEMCRILNPTLVGTDYGLGFDPNDALTRALGPQRLAKYHYVHRLKGKVRLDPMNHCYRVYRSPVLTDMFLAMKAHKLRFFKWNDFEPYGEDILNVYTEYSSQLREIKYDHRPLYPDDTLHAVVFCFLASMIIRPRPDVIIPMKEDLAQPGYDPLEKDQYDY